MSYSASYSCAFSMYITCMDPIECPYYIPPLYHVCQAARRNTCSRSPYGVPCKQGSQSPQRTLGCVPCPSHFPSFSSYSPHRIMWATWTEFYFTFFRSVLMGKGTLFSVERVTLCGVYTPFSLLFGCGLFIRCSLPIGQWFSTAMPLALARLKSSFPFSA